MTWCINCTPDIFVKLLFILLLLTQNRTLYSLSQCMTTEKMNFSIYSNNLSKRKYKLDSLVLIWNTNWDPQFGYSNCEGSFDIGSFKITTNKRDLDIAYIVIFHQSETHNNFPQRTRSDQIWVWLNVEPPKNVKDITYANGVYNLTASYRHDSDIYLPYGYFIQEPDNYSYSHKTHNSFSDQKKLVSWFIHGWETDSLRVKYYETLQHILDIDIYGKDNRIPVNQKCEIISQYKFYLSFENSNVTDYITEKIWENAFICGAIPIALGTSKSTYLKNGIPEDSFIHVDDFKSQKDLVSFVEKIAKNEELYNSYFKWRKGRSIYFSARFGTYSCRVIEYMNKNIVNPRIVSDLHEWFIS
ncbi:Alpha-(1,3)-fucosyltransferase [Tritrichomonas foetus]|uniref:Fucosyltransferase n=1 Tax=Tritrichomonas foetus TaxID=1144522 RepID=A0A1J4KQK4_9EUKA|nr:Alpha-(1,3)-fucosyltransferase [Tritrichomonas foetus]|eukprot:OHT12068.1 Alpha-(1,3)-fucosyltransferase [Tritrichomonas foetus]